MKRSPLVGHHLLAPVAVFMTYETITTDINPNGYPEGAIAVFINSEKKVVRVYVNAEKKGVRRWAYCPMGTVRPHLAERIRAVQNITLPPVWDEGSLS